MLYGLRLSVNLESFRKDKEDCFFLLQGANNEREFFVSYYCTSNFWLFFSPLIFMKYRTILLHSTVTTDEYIYLLNLKMQIQSTYASERHTFLPAPTMQGLARIYAFCNGNNKSLKKMARKQFTLNTK